MAPPGTLRIEFGGSFSPASREHADGSLRDLGDPLTIAERTAATSPLVADMASRLGGLLGRGSDGGSLGSITADLSFQRGVGTIGLALGVSRRLTGFATIPIVSVRTEARLVTDATGATLGLNPVLDNDPRTGAFFAAFDDAITTLKTRIEAGEYAGNPELEVAAAAWYTEAFELREAMADLLFTDGRLSPILPLAGTPDATDLLAAVGEAQGRFTDEFGVPFTGAPALPTTVVTDEQVTSLIGDRAGYGYLPFDGQPFVALGDIELGVAFELARRGNPGEASWSGAWLLGSGTLATGTAPRDNVLRDQGTGDRQSDLILAAIGEAGRGRLGLRAELGYRIQQKTDRLVRIGSRDEFLRPVSRTAPVTWKPGNSFRLVARPFFRLANHLALTASIGYLDRGADTWSYVAGGIPASGGDPASMGAGTGVSRLDLGLGVSYAHDGVSREGIRRMPVEAGLSVERTASSGSGLVPDGITTRVWFRVSKRLFSR
jgi:hypothetical protein